jgi:hypothetical protein
LSCVKVSGALPFFRSQLFFFAAATLALQEPYFCDCFRFASGELRGKD